MRNSLEKNRAYEKEYFAKNPNAQRNKVLAYTQKTRLAALAILGGKCVSCGFSDSRALQIDHINSDGNLDRGQIGGGALSNKVIKSVLAKENKYQLLCANCNWIKRVEKKEATGKPRILIINKQ